MSDEPRPGSLASRLTASTTILVVEDEPDIATFLSAYFKASGYAMVHLDPDSPAAVVTAVLEHQPACVLLDQHLRGFTGLDCYRQLRDTPGAPVLPVVMVTADSSLVTRAAAAADGLDAFVTKPFSMSELFALVTERITRAGVQADVGHDDAVTGTRTHAFLQSRLADELGLARVGGWTVSLALVKVSSLRETNARVGYAAGDYVLRSVGQRLRASLPPGVVVGRSGGAEFGILFPASRDSATDIAETALAGALADAAASILLPGGQEVAVVLRAGLASHPAHARDPDSLYMAADEALARAVEGSTLLARAL